MKSIFDDVSNDCSKIVTKTYSTSFSLATKMLSKKIRQHIYNIYGFVRFADEIVDSFHDYNKEILFKDFSLDLEKSLKNKIHLNPILNSFTLYHRHLFLFINSIYFLLWTGKEALGTMECNIPITSP